MQAQVEDPFLSGFAQMEVENILGIAVGNQKGSGYTVGEIGSENVAFTKKVCYSGLFLQDGSFCA